VQQGEHEELIKESGVYRDLNRMQMGQADQD